ncbi:MAG TPA: glycine zipper 2TM domain-containing protein [Paralcaligenes sp.]
MNSLNSAFLTRRTGRILVLAVAIGALSGLAGCAGQSASSSVYSYGQAQREQVVRTGTIESLRNVTIQNDRPTGFGGLAGGAVGGVVGSTVGRGTGNVLATVGGAIIGAVAGNAVENQTGKTAGVEITVRLDNGETRVIAQANDQPLAIGQRVRMISGNGPTRVVPM